MDKNIPLIIFGYAFPHKKTYDFVSILFAKGLRNIVVIGAPKLLLKGNKTINLKKNNIEENSYCIKDLCSSLGIEFVECAHDKIEVIEDIRDRIKAKIALISGARILKKEIIDLFDNGIINFHPGKIPETSGLDSFFYTIEKNCSPGITVHVIDEKVDAGKLIFFEQLFVKENESMKEVRANLYATQSKALGNYLDFYFGKDIDYPEINRPKKNIPLSEAKKLEITSQYDSWLDAQLKLQTSFEKEFYELCSKKDHKKIEQLIKENSYYLYLKGQDGKTIFDFLNKENDLVFAVKSFLENYKLFD